MMGGGGIWYGHKSAEWQVETGESQEEHELLGRKMGRSKDKWNGAFLLRLYYPPWMASAKAVAFQENQKSYYFVWKIH